VQDQGGEERQQEQGKPQTSAEGRQVCVPLHVREVCLSDQQMVPVCAKVHLYLGEIRIYSTCTTVLYRAVHESSDFRYQQTRLHLHFMSH
jgi:hypothetical protein